MQKILRPGTKRNIRRILPYGLIWLLSGWIFLVVELAASGDAGGLPETAIKFDLSIIIFSSIAITGVGLLTGVIELKYLDNVFADKNFALRFFYKLLIYFLFLLVITLITFPVAASLELNTHLFDKVVWDKYVDYLTSVTHLSTTVQLATALVLSLFYSEISEFIGQGVLLNFFTGKYHTPIEEERIFMFLDMKSSTTIAEQLGHVQYFRLLQEYYYCFTDAIIEHEGEIYQYVGDEVILSWKFRGDKLDNRCIDCFFALNEHLKAQASRFSERFGVIPTFKAGIHFGKVTTGEIGVIKKDILFSGDVLNAAARIQGLCNTYQVDLMVSGDLMNQLVLDPPYEALYLGEAELRGKKEKKQLYTVRTDASLQSAGKGNP